VDDRSQQQQIMSSAEQAQSTGKSDHQNHLCLVFELLGLNFYEVLKRRQFRGLPLTMVRDIVRQSVDGIKDLSRKHIVHCDLKPENILLVSEDESKYVIGAGDNTIRRENGTDFPSNFNGTKNSAKSDSSTSYTIQANYVRVPGGSSCKIKLIDFGSACFEGYTAHTYIQSRFYRSPEVLIGLPYDSAIDMWSLGCVAAELFLGLPILPGVHEYDQVGRIREVISELPNWHGRIRNSSRLRRICGHHTGQYDRWITGTGASSVAN
jgi:dual specificity protein kinase YAK1